jgi:hypothetical protein
MRPQDLTTAKTVAKISVVSNTAGGKKSVARRSTGLDYSSTPVTAAISDSSLSRLDTGQLRWATATTTRTTRSSNQ